MLVAIFAAISFAHVCVADDVLEDGLHARKPDAAAAIGEAEQAINRALESDTLWFGTWQLLKTAREAFSAKDFDAAIKFAQHVRRRVDLAANQAELEAAYYVLEHEAHTLDDADVDALKGLVQAKDGAGAMHLIRQSRAVAKDKP